MLCLGHGASRGVIPAEMVSAYRAGAGGSSRVRGQPCPWFPSPTAGPGPTHLPRPLLVLCSRSPLWDGIEEPRELHRNSWLLEQGYPRAACDNSTCLILLGRMDLFTQPSVTVPWAAGRWGKAGQCRNISCSPLTDLFCNAGQDLLAER